MSERIRYQIEEIDSQEITPVNQAIPQNEIHYRSKTKPHLIILVKKLKDTNESWIVAYKIQQLIHNDLRDSQRIEFALVVLEEKGFIKQINLGNKNYVFVNPHCLVNP